MRALKVSIGLIALLLTGAAQSQVFDVSFGQGPPTRTLLIPAESAKATVLLYIGGDGQLKLSERGFTLHGHTFVRSKEYWKKYGINAVLVDTPNDLGSASRGHHRASDDHIDRVKAVAEFYKSRLNHPIWIFGHSMGTSTVSAVVSKRPEIQQTLSGLIIAGTHKGESVPPTITLPLLAIHHAKEACAATPISASEEIVKSRPKNLRTEFVLIDGGLDEGKPCMAMAYHGFNRTEDKLIEAAAKFILSN
jgi:hypothetical protein